jgi:transposase-like protein
MRWRRKTETLPLSEKAVFSAAGDMPMGLGLSSIADPCFQNEEEAYQFVEQRIWPQGAVCPRCGSARRTSKLNGTSTRIGTYKCYACRKPFTVKIGTMFESSHVLMHVWLKAIFLLSSSDGRMTIRNLQDVLEVSPKTVVLIMRRIEQALHCNREGDAFARVTSPVGRRRWKRQITAASSGNS